MPLFWTETLLFWMLGLTTSTGFRMFPRADTVTDYPANAAHSYVLITIMCIPNFISWDRYMNGRAALGGYSPSSDERSQPVRIVCSRLAGGGLGKFGGGLVHDGL